MGAAYRIVTLALTSALSSHRIHEGPAATIAVLSMGSATIHLRPGGPLADAIPSFAGTAIYGSEKEPYSDVYIDVAAGGTGEAKILISPILMDVLPPPKAPGSLAATATTNQVAINGGATATLVRAANPARAWLTLKNEDSAIKVWVGPLGVTTTTGQSLAPGESMPWDALSAVYAIETSGAPQMSISEGSY